MTRRRFTPEEIQLLRNNPNTQFVSDSMIRFTADFKNDLYNRTMAGENPKTVFQDAGYDLALLGDYRVYNTLYSVTEKKVSDLEIQKNPDQIQRLEAELRSVKLELETLKKMIRLTTSKRSTDS